MDEQRKQKRRHLVLYLMVLDRQTGRLVARLGDITADGVLLVRERPFLEGESLEVRIVHPANFNGPDAMDLDIVCRWARPDQNPGLHLGGFQVVAGMDTSSLEELVEAYGFED